VQTQKEGKKAKRGLRHAKRQAEEEAHRVPAAVKKVGQAEQESQQKSSRGKYNEIFPEERVSPINAKKKSTVSGFGGPGGSLKKRQKRMCTAEGKGWGRGKRLKGRERQPPTDLRQCLP